jgi:hypothetical protein
MLLSNPNLKCAKFGAPIAFAATLAVCCTAAQATTFAFQNEYYVSTMGEFNTLFPGAGGYSSMGVYQETNTTTPTVRRLASSGAPGEFVQNTTPDATQALSLNGWSGSYNNGTPLYNNVYNSTNPANGSVLYMQYKTGVTPPFIGTGTTTAFTLNSIDFRTATVSGNLTFTLDGYLGGVLQDSAVLNVTGNTFTTFTENWSNVDTVEIDSTAQNPVNWGSGTLYLGTVVINNVPVPAPLMGHGLPALLGAGGLLFGARLWGRSRKPFAGNRCPLHAA